MTVWNFTLSHRIINEQLINNKYTLVDTVSLYLQREISKNSVDITINEFIYFIFGKAILLNKIKKIYFNI